MSRYRQLPLLFSLLGLCLLVQACSAIRVAQAPPARVTIRLVQLPYLTFAPFFIAQEEGFFNAQGLDIENVKLERTAQAIPALVSGQLDVLGGAVDSATL